MKDVFLQGGSVGVNGSIDTNVNNNDYTPFKVELVNAAPAYQPQLTPSLVGTFHVEARKGYLVFRDRYNNGVVTIVDTSTIMYVKTTAGTIQFHFRGEEYPCSIDTDEEIGLTPDFLLDLLEATKTGEHLSTIRENSPSEEEKADG